MGGGRRRTQNLLGIKTAWHMSCEQARKWFGSPALVLNEKGPLVDILRLLEGRLGLLPVQ